MKYVVMSFDDGREDFFINAYPILRKYGLSATLNVVTKYIGKNNAPMGVSPNGKCVSWAQIQTMKKSGIEIACHSHSHTNDADDVINGYKILKEKLGDSQIGFASPSSHLYSGNFDVSHKFLKAFSYVRSGNQLARDGCLSALLYILSVLLKSKRIFNIYNEKNYIDLKRYYKFFPSVTCNRQTKLKQILYMLEKLPDEKALIIMFHSVVEKNDNVYRINKWTTLVDDFEEICKYLSQNSNIEVITNQELAYKMKR